MVDSTRTDLMFALRLQGLTYAEIARRVHLSRQRVQQILRPPTAIYRAVCARANHACEACGIETPNGHVHHVKAKGLTPDTYSALENLQYLCQRCHVNVHMTGMTPREQQEWLKVRGIDG